MTDIVVTCEANAGGAWACVVTVDDGHVAYLQTDGHGTQTRHDVTVTTGDLELLAPGAIDPVDLVRRSFEFLLEREPPSSILARFDLPLIGRYFPDYERTIRG